MTTMGMLNMRIKDNFGTYFCYSKIETTKENAYQILDIMKNDTSVKYKYGIQVDNIDHKYFIISLNKTSEKFILRKLGSFIFISEIKNNQ